MILYFADRRFNVLDQVSTLLPDGLIVSDDLKVEDVETGVATFECRMPFDSKTRNRVKSCIEVGNYILRKHNDENEYFTIIDSEWDEKNREVYIYAEDAGLDLLNEIVGGYAATESKPISHYIEQFAYDSGFEIGINEIENLTRKLSWEGEETITARLASVATQFDHAEISYSFDVKGLRVVKKYINIHKKRGQDAGVQLRMNREIDNIVISKSIANVATALRVTGGIPEDSDTPITLDGYKYDDGDFFLEGTYLKSREAHAIWSRYLAENGTYTGHICKRFEYDTTSQSELCNRAIAELKKMREVEINYKIDITNLPENVRIGDRVNVVDDENELYVSARILRLETSVVNRTQTATIGEYLIKDSGISQKVADLAAQFAGEAEEIKKAHQEALEAQKKAEEAKQSADNAQSAVENVEKDVETLDSKVTASQEAVDLANKAAQEAKVNASEAITKATQSQTASDEARTQASNAQVKAEQAISDASDASTIAQAAKLDAEQAKADVAEFEGNLTTLENTMKADYARKSELTETETSLQSQISQNASQIASTVTRVNSIDETANSANSKAESAQQTADNAQAQADQAKANAASAQTRADEANAKAQQAANDLATAEQNLASVTNRVGATEEEIAQAQADVVNAKKAADDAQADADAAQTAANNAKTAADNAQSAANKAQADVDKLAVRMTSAETSITQNAEQIELRAKKTEVTETLGGYYTKAQTDSAITTKASEITSSVSSTYATKSALSTTDTKATNAKTAADNAQADIDNLSSGGRNLIAGTSKSTEYSGNKGSSTYKDVWSGKTIDIPTGTEYIVSFDAKADAAQNVACYFYSPNTTTKAESSTGQSSTSADGNCVVTLTTSWKRYWVKWTQTGATAVKNVIVARNSTANNVYVRAVKLEEGNRASSWTPAPEDMATAESVTSLSTRVTQTENSIASQASEIDGLGSRMSTVEQTANGLTISLQTTNNNVTTVQNTADEAKTNAAKAQTTANTANTNATNAQTTANTANTNAATAQETADTANANAQAAQNTANTANTNATNAAKTATNFLSYDSTNGLLVGNKSSGSWSGYRTQVKSDSFNILDASGNALATYGANKIELGKNSDDTVIEMCGGKGKIQMDSSKEFLQFTGEMVQMISKDIVSGEEYQSDGSVEEWECESSAGIDVTYEEGGVRGMRSARVFAIKKDLEDENSSYGSYVRVAGEHMMLECVHGNYENHAGITMTPGDINIEADEYVQVTAPFLTMQGDLAVVGNIEDAFGSRYKNGLASYSSASEGGIDANTTLEPLILTNINTPVSEEFYYIETNFYSEKKTTARRMQIAYPYKSDLSIYFRYYTTLWTTWKEIPVLLESGTSGVWTYEKWSNGKAKCLGRIPVSNIPITTAVGSFYRSGTIYDPESYTYPIAFAEAPVATASFLNTNGYSAFLWGLGDAHIKTVPPEYYLMRPNTATASGYVSVSVEGRWK